MHKWKNDSWQDRLADFLKDPERWQKYDYPFPMGVFGTLRHNQGNNRLMHYGKVAETKKAFLPHFRASGLSIMFEENASAPFDVFFYEPGEWNKMIPSVDRLESFTPEYCHKEKGYGYYRTLVGLRILPDDYTHPVGFPAEGRCQLWGDRNLEIDPKTFKDYQVIPAWVYSNQTSNRRCLECFEKKDIPAPHYKDGVYTDCPILWPLPDKTFS